MASSVETDLLILGDLFDDFDVDGRDWLDTYTILNDWLCHGKTLKLIAGNHDGAAKGTRLSSFTMLAHVLSEQYPSQVTVLDIGQSGLVCGGVMAIAHHANQDLFNLALDAALVSEESFHTLLLHCNLDNHFAQQADHSLDLSAEMAEKFAERGVSILLAHEHNSRKVRNVTVLGCQFVTSVADCIDSPKKFAHTLNDGVLTAFETWSASGSDGFARLDWRDLNGYAGTAKFIRVEGSASSGEAGDAITAVAKFRSKSGAFVVTQAVKIEGVMDNSDLPDAFEATQAFDVLEFINENLDGAQRAAVSKLLGTAQ